MVGFSGYNLNKLVDYLINFEEISNELCENQDTDITQCNGICYLVDQIIEVQKPDEGITMEYVQLNLDFHFYFFQGAEELASVRSVVLHSFDFLARETCSGYFEQAVPPPC